MDESILITIKKMLGIAPEDGAFDTDIITHINTVINDLYQLGIGSGSFFIEDGSEEWSDYVEDIERYMAVKDYIYIKTKLIFDPPLSSFLIENLKKRLDELEFRLLVQKDVEIQNGEV